MSNEKTSKRAVIYTGGECFPTLVFERPRAGDLILAADSGYRTAQKLGIVPHILLGDFDSLGEPQNVPESVEIIRVPAEKDVTDTQLAVRIALERGATEIFIVGGFGSRPDHLLSNFAILEMLARKGIPAIMLNGKNRARFLASGSVTIARDDRFRYLSLITANKITTGVTISGCRYPLQNATLHRTHQFAVSNEIINPFATISTASGGLWILEVAEG
ncbi:MAG: thiamine diphosphokinase [Ruminococcaceae bacterium]|nr:thiamine diphosphokinase [Oscillospiraceae bacterium]